MNEELFQDRIKKAVALLGNASLMATATGISSRSISAYINGESDPSRERLVSIADAANVNLLWLATGEGPMRKGQTALTGESMEGEAGETPGEREEVYYEDAREQIQQSHTTDIPQWGKPDADAFHYVPMAKAKLSAGGGMFILSEDVSDYYAFRKNWLKRIASSPKSVVLMEVQGNSMAPTILDKDTVMIDTGRVEIIEGMIYAIRLDQTIMIKRLTHRPGGIVNVISDNKEEFEPYQAHRKDVHIIGQIIYFSRDLISGY